MSRIDARTQGAIYGRKIIGFAISHPLIDPENYSEDTDTEHLSLLMIDPDYWGRRIASRLLDITVKHALDTGRSHLTLWTRERDNRRAQAVYEHKGFSLTGIPKTTKDGRQVHYQLDL
jgi:GNAT superfamily N-acetyltransferase